MVDLINGAVIHRKSSFAFLLGHFLFPLLHMFWYFILSFFSLCFFHHFLLLLKYKKHPYFLFTCQRQINSGGWWNSFLVRPLVSTIQCVITLILTFILSSLWFSNNITRTSYSYMNIQIPYYINTIPSFI